MSKKLFPAVLLFALTAFFFSGCSFSSEPDKGTAPTLNEAFFFQMNNETKECDNRSTLWNNVITEMPIYNNNNKVNEYGIYYNITDPDYDVAYLQISFDGKKFISFNEYPLGTMPSTTKSVEINKWRWNPKYATEGPIYFRVKDSMNNKSNVVTVNAKIINNSASTSTK